MSKSISTVGDSTSGHGGPFPPTLISSGSPKVLIEGKPATTIGANAIPHVRMKKPYDVHAPVVSSGSSKVFIGGIAASGTGDTLSCGGTIATGSGKVNIG